MSGNGSFYQSQASCGILDGQTVKGQHSRALEGSLKFCGRFDRQLSFNKQLSGHSTLHDDFRSPS